MHGHTFPITVTESYVLNYLPPCQHTKLHMYAYRYIMSYFDFFVHTYNQYTIYIANAAIELGTRNMQLR